MDEMSRHSDRTTGINSEMQSIVRAAAEPGRPGELVKSAILRASRRLKIKFRRARGFWYGEQYSVRADEADHMRAAELRLLAERERRLSGELALIRARLDAQTQTMDGPPDSIRAAVAGRETGGGSEEAAAPRIGSGTTD